MIVLSMLQSKCVLTLGKPKLLQKHCRTQPPCQHRRIFRVVLLLFLLFLCMLVVGLAANLTRVGVA